MTTGLPPTERRTVEIHNPDPQWPRIFERIENEMRAALGDAALRIDHVGSTAVPGLGAKPVIDVQISVASFEPEAGYKNPLESLGYRLRPDPDEPGHRFFYFDEGDTRLVNVHVCESGGDWERKHLLFRDYLRAHPTEARAYEASKRELARRDWDRVNDYAEAKQSWIRPAVERAESWAGEAGWSL